MSELVLLAQIAGRRVALRAKEVHSVVELDTVTPVPRTPDFIAGLAALRSRALTVVDCRRSLELPTDEAARDREAVVVEHQTHLYALLVDGVDDVVAVEGEAAQVPGDYGTGWERIARSMVETPRGPALMIDVGALVSGPVARAA